MLGHSLHQVVNYLIMQAANGNPACDGFHAWQMQQRMHHMVFRH